MSRPAIVPTVTHHVRQFLMSQGVTLKPWSGLDETYGELYGLLRAKRRDRTFWKPLAELLETIVECATDEEKGYLPAPQAELLKTWDIAELTRDLQAALPQENEPIGPARFASRLPAASMGAFLILGLVASGCSSATAASPNGDADIGGDADQTADADAPPDADEVLDAEPDTDIPSWAVDCTLNRDGVLFQTLLESEIDDYSKGDLCRCFTTLNASWNDGLRELFENGSPEEVAAALQEMMECCWDPYPFEQNFDDVRDRFLDGSLCHIAMPYRGVAFDE